MVSMVYNHDILESVQRYSFSNEHPISVDKTHCSLFKL